MVSVIIPVYNAEQWLQRCLSSVLNQTYRDMEIIVVNDGSTDNSPDIIRQFAASDSRLRIIERENGGQAVARNQGMKTADGEYICFVDADDWIAPAYIANLVSSIDDCDMVQTGYRFYQNNCISGTEYPRMYRFTAPWARLYRTDFLRRHHVDFPEGMIYEDVIFSLRLWAAKPYVKMVPDADYFYCVNPESTTADSHPEARKKLYRMIWTTSASFPLKIYTFIRLLFHFWLK